MSYTKEDILELVKGCTTLKEIFFKLGYTKEKISQNTRNHWLKIFEKFDINIKKEIEQNKIIKCECQNCGMIFYKKSSKSQKGLFCSKHCARSYSSNSNKKERLQKVSASLKKYYKTHPFSSVAHLKKKKEYEEIQPKCIICGKDLTYHQFICKITHCSRGCASKHNSLKQRKWNHRYYGSGKLVHRNGNYIVYKITSLIDDTYYLGVHRLNDDSLNWDDTYYGSGILIKEKIKKYGKENFKREIIERFDNSTDAYEYEKQIIQEHKTNKKCLNLASGGIGGFNMFLK